MRSSEVPVRILPFAPFGAPPPLIFLEANAFVQWLAKTRAQKNASREWGFASSPSPAGGGSRPKGAGWGARRGVQIEADEIPPRPSPPPAGLRAATSPLQGEVRQHWKAW